MPDAESSASEAPVPFGARAAIRLGLAFLCGFAAVVAFTLRDSGRRPELEHFEEVSAVGDTNYFAIPNPLPNPPTPVATYGGKSWVPVDYERVDPYDSQMIRAGRDEATGLTLYRPREKAKPDELYLKIELNGFVRLRPQ